MPEQFYFSACVQMAPLSKDTSLLFVCLSFCFAPVLSLEIAVFISNFFPKNCLYSRKQIGQLGESSIAIRMKEKQKLYESKPANFLI